MSYEPWARRVPHLSISCYLYTVPNHRKLEVWRKAHQLALSVYRLTSTLPSSERFGLQSQMRRAAVSIPSNLAEGAGRGTDRDFGRFVSNAIGSSNELDYQLELVLDLGYAPERTVLEARSAIAEIRRMLIALRSRLLEDKRN